MRQPAQPCRLHGEHLPHTQERSAFFHLLFRKRKIQTRRTLVYNLVANTHVGMLCPSCSVNMWWSCPTGLQLHRDMIVEVFVDSGKTIRQEEKKNQLNCYLIPQQQEIKTILFFFFMILSSSVPRMNGGEYECEMQ